MLILMMKRRWRRGSGGPHRHRGPHRGSLWGLLSSRVMDNGLRAFALFLILSSVGCNSSPPKFSKLDMTEASEKGALLTTRFNSFEELKSVIQIDYSGGTESSPSNTLVQLTHRSNGTEVTSILESGISEKDFIKAQKGSLWDRIKLGFRSPYAVMNRTGLLQAYILARRRYDVFGEGDIAFYDFAETMVSHISAVDLDSIPPKDLSDKGYLNTFNHITAQAFMTTIFSEEIADFIADVHERARLPELITGQFTEEQLKDLKNGPVDNYVDIINNEWGQELGKTLKKKYAISRRTYWTPDLLPNYLNDIQRYYSWAFQIGFKPFKATDEIILKFSHKINTVMGDAARLK